MVFIRREREGEERRKERGVGGRGRRKEGIGGRRYRRERAYEGEVVGGSGHMRERAYEGEGILEYCTLYTNVTFKKQLPNIHNIYIQTVHVS